MYMGLPNKDEMKGKYEQVKGDVKKKTGEVFDDPEMVREGQADKARGNVRETFGEGKRKVGEAIEDIGEAVKR
jgi:uncharacterized protein YjbJ (UPF0337 family)